ncbi:uncharacterized protein LOC142230771 [Haematobia irritans]|uniref:uncharacterized protein LOC142230771 n=1 Tax=Haematobia irritans TaxID=7368 RepID=UPI003F4F98D2
MLVTIKKAFDAASGILTEKVNHSKYLDGENVIGIILGKIVETSKDKGIEDGGIEFSRFFISFLVQSPSFRLTLKASPQSFLPSIALHKLATYLGFYAVTSWVIAPPTTKKISWQAASLKASTTFLIKCKQTGIIPKFITNTTTHTYNIFNTNNLPPKFKRELEKHNYNFHTKVLNLIIQYKHMQIHKNTIMISNAKDKLSKVMSTDDYNKFIETEGDECIQTLDNKEEQENARVRLASLIDDHIQKTKPNKKEKFILDTVGETRKYLKENKDLLILTADKGGKTVAMYKDDYEIKMKNILRDICTYRRLKRDPTSTLQTKNNKLVEKLFRMNIIDTNEKLKLICKTANAPRIYGLPKIHKEGVPVRPICSSINSPSYELSNYIVNILKNLTKDSKYNVKDAIEFKNKTSNIKIEDNETMISFDVVSLFPSIPVNLAIKIIKEKWDEIKDYTKIPMDIFIEMLTFCIKDSRYFVYDDKVYEQRKGMPMGSLASPIIADIVMEVLLDSATLSALNAFDRQIQFTMETEEDNKLPYLDTIILRHRNGIKINWYQKPTATGRLINFNSKHPRRVIMNTATNFIRRLTLPDFRIVGSKSGRRGCYIQAI